VPRVTVSSPSSSATGEAAKRLGKGEGNRPAAPKGQHSASGKGSRLVRMRQERLSGLRG